MSNKNSTSSDKPSNPVVNLPAASLLRILGAWVYDFMLLCAVWLLAGVVYLIPAQIFSNIDSSQTESLSTTEFTGPLFYSYLFIVTWFFFAWFWTHGGQTLGLRTWSLRLQTVEGHALNWTLTLLRFMVAGAPWLLALFLYAQISDSQLIEPPYQYIIFLVGFTGVFWIVLDRQNRSLQDIFSHTRIVKLPKKPKKAKKN